MGAVQKEEFLIFNMLGVAYGIRLTRIREILTFTGQITPLPNNPEWVRGVINLRGEVTPVIDFRLKFSSIRQLYDEETIIIALRLPQDRMMAIVVDNIESITELEAAKAEKAPDIGCAIELRVVEGLIRVGGEMVTLLDVDALTDLNEI